METLLIDKIIRVEKKKKKKSDEQNLRIYKTLIIISKCEC